MIVLGFSGGFKGASEDDVWGNVYHDASAALVKDGEILAAIEEERLSRLKHTNCFPRQAIECCLRTAGITWRDVDLIATAFQAGPLGYFAQSEALRDIAMPMPRDAADYIASLFERDFGIAPHDRLRFYDHHDAHVWSAYAPSGFDEALILSIDGAGDGRSGQVCVGQRHTMQMVREYDVNLSLGHLYARIIKLLGYTKFDEYKAMALAPYGDPRVYRSLFAAGYSLLPDGHYQIDTDRNWLQRFAAIDVLPRARRKDAPFEQVHKDLAAALQEMLEAIVLHVLRHFRSATGITSLCLSGGVAHNCAMNGTLLRSGLFDRIFVQPASHDGGLSLGACYACLAEAAPAAPSAAMREVFLGSPLEPATVRETLAAWSALVEVETVDDPIAAAAALLADGAVIGWVQGRSEFGPRALGNRSILADPRPARQRDLINSMVKKREQFRPFAPSVMVERAREFFSIADCQADLSFMTYTVPVREEWRERLQAVTHVDGTARIQTVSREISPCYWGLLHEFGRLTDVPIVLNTSFNNDVEPIVDSVEDAIVCYLTTGIHYLVVGNCLVRRRAPKVPDEQLMTLTVDVPATRRLVRHGGNGHASHYVESMKARLERRARVNISAETYEVLSRSDGRRSVRDLTERHAAQGELVMRELAELWSARLIRLRPATA